MVLVPQGKVKNMPTITDISLEKLDKFLNSEKGKETLERLRQKEKIKKLKSIQFYNTKEFKRIFSLIKNGLESQSYEIINESFFENSDFVIDGLSEKDFLKFHYSVMNKFESLVYEDEFDMFLTEKVNYKGLELSVTYGQGEPIREVELLRKVLVEKKQYNEYE